VLYAQAVFHRAGHVEAAAFANFKTLISGNTHSTDLTSMTARNDSTKFEGVIQSYLDGLYESDCWQYRPALFHPTRGGDQCLRNDGGEMGYHDPVDQLGWTKVRVPRTSPECSKGMPPTRINY